MATSSTRANVNAGIERRVPPNSQTAEIAVLGGVLLDQDSLDLVIDILQVEDFYAPAHQKLFRSLRGLHDRGSAIDPVTLKNELTDRGWLEEIGGHAYIDRIQEEVYTSANIEQHARIVAEKSLLRQLLAVTHTIQGMVFDGRTAHDEDLDSEQIIDRSQQLVFEIARDKVGAPYDALETVIQDALAYVDERNEAQGGLAGHSTGFPDLDTVTNGFKPSELIILAARPAMGKTSLALNFAVNMALRERLPVLFFSLEMSAVQVGLRLLTSQAGIFSDKVFKGQLTDADYSEIAKAAGVLGEAPLFIDDGSNINVNTIRAKSRRLKAEQGKLGMIVVDYLQLMQPTRPRESREQQIAEISRNLKFIAKELECPVVALGQLNRALESRENKRPRLSDLRESGSLEQDADIVMFLYRDSEYWPDEEKRSPENNDKLNVTELIIGKNRSGQTKTVGLYFHKEFTRFDSFSLGKD